MTAQKNNPLHGLTLEAIVTALVDAYGFEELGRRIDIRCFQSDPSVSSSLKFLRKTPWARAKVESLYLFLQREKKRAAARDAAVAAVADAADAADDHVDVDKGDV